MEAVTRKTTWSGKKLTRLPEVETRVKPAPLAPALSLLSPSKAGLVAEAIRLMDQAIAHGVTWFDTARAYGCAERRIGLALESEARDRVRLVTKLDPPASPRLKHAQELPEMPGAWSVSVTTGRRSATIFAKLSKTPQKALRFVDLP